MSGLFEEEVTVEDPLAPAAQDAPLADRMRPHSLEEFVGQRHLVGQGKILTSALGGNLTQSLILWGPPGVGKTTLARLIAAASGLSFVSYSAVLSGIKEIRTLMVQAAEEKARSGDRTLVFVDEIHRLSPVVEEVLYPAMEDFHLDIMIGEGPGARSIKLELPPFTLVGATTRAGLLTSPLRDRFGIVQRLEFYTTTELAQIVARTASLLDLPADDAGVQQIAGRSRGTARIANRLVRRVRDFAEVEADGRVNEEVARAAMDLLEVDPRGFDVMDRKLLSTIIEKFDGGPVGIDNLAAAIGEERGTLEDVVEPFLIQEGFLQRTSRGRVATPLAYEHFGGDLSASAAPRSRGLFD